MKDRVLLGLAFLLAASLSLSAQESVGRGVGTATCAEIAKLRLALSGSDRTFTSWARGFMTGWNFAAQSLGKRARNLNATAVENQETFIAQHCDRNPQHRYLQAVMALYVSLPELSRQKK